MCVVAALVLGIITKQYRESHPGRPVAPQSAKQHHRAAKRVTSTNAAPALEPSQSRQSQDDDD